MSVNSTSLCPKETAQNPPPLFQNGHLVLQTYHVGWIISGSFVLVAILISFWLIRKHLQWYTNKREQRYIVRILFLVPIYALISFASFLFWNHATPLLLVRDAYEAIVLTSFFYLLLTYLSHDPEEQKMIFLKSGLSFEADQTARQKGDEIKHWLFPMGFVTWKPRDGLYFLQLMKWGVLQYCVIRPITTLAAVILDYMGLYCEQSWGLGSGHIYITIIVSLSVTVAMYCLIQIYVSVSKDLAAHKPLLKLFSIKVVVFLTFWQATFLSVLSWVNVIKASKYMTSNDVIIAISATLETFEMMLFAVLHIRAFTYKCYQLHPLSSSKSLSHLRTAQWRSLGHAMDFRETFREIWVGWLYLVDKVRGKEPTQDIGTKRVAHYERAFGRQRPFRGKEYTDANVVKYKERTLHPVEIEVDRRVEVMVEGQRQWLGFGRYGRYTWNRPERERSTGLEEQIDQELERRGYLKSLNDPKNIDLQPAGQRSWWRSLYNRLSQTAPDKEDDVNEICTPQNSWKPHYFQHHSFADIQVQDMDCNIAQYPPNIAFDSSAGKGQKFLGATDPAHPFVDNEVSDYMQLSNSYEESQINSTANIHRNFHLSKPHLAAVNVPIRYQMGSSEPTSPVGLQSHLGSSKLPTTRGEDGRPFSSDIRRSNHRREAAAIPHGYKDKAFHASPHHLPSCYHSPVIDARLRTQPPTSSTDPSPSYIPKLRT